MILFSLADVFSFVLQVMSNFRLSKKRCYFLLLVYDNHMTGVNTSNKCDAESIVFKALASTQLIFQYFHACWKGMLEL
jgi:hypothetical protein